MRRSRIEETLAEIILAENHGFCYGVKRAVEMANEAAEGKGKSYTLGPIIHNPQL